MKFVLNKCYGGFGLTIAEKLMLAEDGIIEDEDSVEDIPRNDPTFVKYVEDGAITGGNYSVLRVVEVPDNITDFWIDDYDGVERIIYVLDGKLGSK